MKEIKLTPEEINVIIHKGTERPYSGKYYHHWEAGIYHCKRCGNPLYNSKDKFQSHCGWPAFDDEIPGSVKRQIDRDGKRIEITCSRCGAHLGHVFENEGFTPKNIRHCVNSISLKFQEQKGLKSMIVGGGCFWGIEYYLQQLKGVIETESGYSGGSRKNPSYQEVCSGETGHAEVVKVTYDSNLIDYPAILKAYFEIHDPGQINRQGPDIGTQYRSIVFYQNMEEKNKAESIMEKLRSKGYEVNTELREEKEFWPAEDYHQDYYKKKGKQPYCHFPVKKF